MQIVRNFCMQDLSVKLNYFLYGEKYQLKITSALRSKIIGTIANENLDTNRLIVLASPEPAIDEAWRVVG